MRPSKQQTFRGAGSQGDRWIGRRRAAFTVTSAIGHCRCCMGSVADPRVRHRARKAFDRAPMLARAPQTFSACEKSRNVASDGKAVRSSAVRSGHVQLQTGFVRLIQAIALFATSEAVKPGNYRVSAVVLGLTEALPSSAYGVLHEPLRQAMCELCLHHDAQENMTQGACGSVSDPRSRQVFKLGKPIGRPRP